MAAHQPPAFIDLTQEIGDEDVEGASLQEQADARIPPPRRPSSQRQRPGPDYLHGPRAPAAAAAAADEADSGTDDHDGERPAKRRKAASLRSAADYMNRKLFPTIEEALEQLLPVTYDEARVEAIRNKVYQTIVVNDPSFEHEFERNGPGRSPEFHPRIVSSIWHLISSSRDESAGHPAAAHAKPDAPPSLLPSPPPPPPPPMPPAVLPSIEDDFQFDSHIRDDEDGEWYANGYSAPATSRSTPQPHHPTTAPRSDTTPQRLRMRLKAAKWQSGKAIDALDSRPRVSRTSFGLTARPYLAFRERDLITQQQGRLLGLEVADLSNPQVFHVDFSGEEVKYLADVMRQFFGKISMARAPLEDLRHLFKKARRSQREEELYRAHEHGYVGFDPKPPRALTKRSTDDLMNFLADLYKRKTSKAPRVLTLGRDDVPGPGVARANCAPSLLYAREITGNQAFGSIRRYENFRAAFEANREDSFEPRIEWTNCAGDISSMSWVSPSQFICGTTTHSDSHNQQYNKPGNLLLGSTAGTLRAFPDHRIPRPVVSHGDNALESMVESQDPWLFTSVVSSDYDSHHGLAFTSSFDKTVKVWRVGEDSMSAVSTWYHEGRVNFVLASKYAGRPWPDSPNAQTSTGDVAMVATAADVATAAVRVYKIIPGANQTLQYTFDWYSCTKVHDEEYIPSDKWAYFPAAMRWGLAPAVQHLLLIGYSPRSLTDVDDDIPEDKQHTGELCVWDALRKKQIGVLSAVTRNVFEVAWHPTLAMFAAATSKGISSDRVEGDVRTQIRIFRPNAEGQYQVIRTLDCFAMDINELNIRFVHGSPFSWCGEALLTPFSFFFFLFRPNSHSFAYVTASCTNGKVYVWDTAPTSGDKPKCILEHGPPVEELVGDREREDVGVKFTSWATTTGRLYTGSSDGVVKVWDIRQEGAVFIRDLIECAGPVTFGAFSPDCTRLVVGDGSGRVYLLALDEGEADDHLAPTPGFVNFKISGRQKTIRRPRPFIPHPEAPAPQDEPRQPELGAERAHGYLQRQELQRHPDPTIGAVQGPNYINCGLFCAELHSHYDVNGPLLAAYDRLQQENHKGFSRRRLARLRGPPESDCLQSTHRQNRLLDLNIEELDAETRRDLVNAKAELDMAESDLGLVYEENE